MGLPALMYDGVDRAQYAQAVFALVV
jgi:hypothetical protein